jgi:hypothetical protein
MNRAMTSLPVPLSPRIITVASVAAALRHLFIWSSMAGLRLWAASGLSESLQTAFQRLDFPLQLGVRQRPLDNQQQIFALEGLLQVVEGAVAHGQYRALHRPEGGEEDDGKSGMRFVQPRKDFFSRHPRHAHIQQHQIRRVGQAFGQSLGRIHEDRNRRARQPQHPLDVFTQRGFVVDDQNPAHSVVPPANQWYGWPRVNRAGGNSITKLAPPPILGS